ncbi:MAG: 3D domain-containing protein, partial [Clostridia bacterium]|nr:3D domain-containing protein [Clostridia bacterium]
PVRPGVVAVDPKVIPLGSQVEIVGLGVFSAEDVGGNIKGNRVDIFMPSRGEALHWGVRAVEVRVIP